jgi:hypothetical protein
MDTRVNKNAHAEHHRKEIISLRKRAYFFNPVDYGGFYPSGGHPASSTLFTEPPEAETGPVLRLFFPAGDEVIKKVSREGKKAGRSRAPVSGFPYRWSICSLPGGTGEHSPLSTELQGRCGGKFMQRGVAAQRNSTLRLLGERA